MDLPQVTVRWGKGPHERTLRLSNAIVIGRSADCEIQVDRPTIGREHVEIRREGSRIVIKDRYASGGSRVNGNALTPGEHRRLVDGDVVTILAARGDEVVRLVVEIVDPDESHRIGRRSAHFTQAQKETARALVETDPPRYRTIDEMSEVLCLSERQVRARLESLRVALRVPDYRGEKLRSRVYEEVLKEGLYRS